MDCESPEHPGVQLGLSPGIDKTFDFPVADGFVYSASECTISIGRCYRTRSRLGSMVTYVVGKKAFLVGMSYQSDGSVVVDHDPEGLDALSDELLPHARVEVIESWCRLQTGRACEIEFGPWIEADEWNRLHPRERRSGSK